MRTKDAKVQWKQSDSDSNVVTGYASTFGGEPDSYGDIVVHGAFAKTIQERVKAGKVCLCDGHRYESKNVIGILTDGVEDSHGLLIEAKISEAPSAQEAKVKMLEGVITGLSIGYDVILDAYEKTTDGDYIRYLKELKLMEVSITPIPANDHARVVTVKESEYHELPIAPLDTPWNPDEAALRLKKWAHIDGIPNTKYKRAFLLFKKSDPHSLDSCIHQIADVVNGELKVIPRALFGVVGRHWKDQKSDSELERHVEKYLARLGMPPPWKSQSIDELLWNARAGLVDRDGLQHAIDQLRAMSGAGPDEPPTSKQAVERLMKRSEEIQRRLAT